MIRINLLKERAGSNDLLPPALDASGTPSRFLTKRELILALALVTIGGGIIAAQLMGIFEAPPADDEPLVATYERPTAPEPAAPVSAPPVSAPLPVETASSTSVELAIAESPAPSGTPVVAPTDFPAEREFGAEPTYIVTALKLVPEGQAIEVLAEVQGQPEYRSFWLKNPDRLVIDLQDAELRVPPGELSQPSSHPLIRQLRAAQNSYEPPLVRIVVETGREGPVEITAAAAGISVKLSPAP